MGVLQRTSVGEAVVGGLNGAGPAVVEAEQPVVGVSRWADPGSRTVAESAESGELRTVGVGATVGGSGYVRAGRCGCGRPVCVGGLDVGSVREDELLDLMVDLGRARARVEGMLMAVAGEVARRNGWQATAWMMREYNRMSSAQARSEAGLAYTLASEGLDETVRALSDGEINLSHARVAARASGKEHARPEAELLNLSRDYPSDVVGRHIVAYEPAAKTPEEEQAEQDARDGEYGTDAAAVELRAQRDARRARMTLGEDGMWQLSARFDSITGKRLHQIYQSALRAVRNRAGSADHTHPQRAADAVAELFGGFGDCKREQTTLLVLADYNHQSGHLENPRLDDGTPIPVEVAARLAAGGKVMPVLFDAEWQNIAIGTSRNPNQAQKLLLAARDGGCVGCQAPVEETQAHHIKYWRNGGPTLISNLTLLCHTCHDLVHEHNHQIHYPNHDGRPKLQPPDHPANPPPETKP